MEDFLKTNNLYHLAAVFEAQNITELELLDLLTDEEIANLVDNIGDKIRLKRGITNLRSKRVLETEDSENDFPKKVQILDKPMNKEDSLELELSQNISDQSIPIIYISDDTNVVPSNPISSTCLSPSYTSTNTVDSDFSLSSDTHIVVENIDLNAILSKDYLGQALLSKGKNQGLISSERDKLCDIVVSQLLNVFQGKLTLCHFRVVSKKLIDLLPKEKQGTYFIEPILKKDSPRKKSEPARGKLIEKYRNKIHLIRKLDQNASNDETSTEKIDNVLDQSVTDSKIWLSKNVEPQGEVLNHWRKSLPLRKISSDAVTIEEYFNQWPILKTILAPDLVEYDFEQIHSTTDLNVSQKLNELFECVYNKRKAQLGTTDNIIYSLLEADITSDSKHTIELFLLPSLVPPKTRTKRGKNCWKPSISESRDSLMIHIQNPGDVGEAKKRQVDFAYSKGIPLQPYILIIGPRLNNVSASLVVINNIEYKCNSVIHAIDFCFKAYQVLDAQYPLASQHLWYLIQWKVYNFHTKKDLSFPYLNELL